MSANNQTLLKFFKGKWYVFSNVMAESWSDEDGEHRNELSLKEAAGVYDTRDEAFEAALKLDAKQGQFEEGTEYGIVCDKLIKDDAPVIIKE